MHKPIPDLIAPVQAAAQNKHYRCTVPQRNFSRLMGILYETEGDVPVEIDLRFFVEPESGLPAFRLRFKSDYPLQCQRTLDAFSYPVEDELQGVFVYEEGAEKLVPEHYDIWQLETASVKPWALIEDELMLAVPIVPKKPGSPRVWLDRQEDEPAEKATQNNPFGVLKALKNKPENQ